MKESMSNETVNMREQLEEGRTKELKKTYNAPNCESHKPLEIMSKWVDGSSELVF